VKKYGGAFATVANGYYARDGFAGQAAQVRWYASSLLDTPQPAGTTLNGSASVNAGFYIGTNRFYGMSLRCLFP
jgi:hypothetical protein